MSNFLSKAFFTQSFRIPAPTLTEKNLADQHGKVHIITGGYAGVGKELASILYSKHATVYIAGRSEQKAQEAIRQVKENHPSSSGRIEFLLLDLNDLTTIKPAVETFRARESRLDVLVNNAGVMFPPKGTKTEQGHDMQMGTNIIGPFLFTKLLMPTLVETAKISPRNTVRVLWAASVGIQAISPPGGIVLTDKDGPKVFDSQETNYGQTKVANVLFAVKTQELFGSQDIVSVSFNPGNLRTELQRHSKGLMMKLAEYMLYPAIYGAYTELYSGWSPDITADKGVSYVMPWGRDGTELLRDDIKRSIDEGVPRKLWDWCDDVTKPYQ